MKLVNSQNRIIELISYFRYQIEAATSMSRTDLNKAAETILIPLLNEIYSWNLENINYSEDNNNYPGIDLVDKVEKITIQVTATPGSEKIKHTIKQFIKHKQYLEYKRLIIFILTQKKPSYPSKTIQEIVQDKFTFDAKKDIWDYRNILQDISDFSIHRTLRLQGILEANFGEEKPVKSPEDKDRKQFFFWKKTCQELLKQWGGITTNILTRPNGVNFQLDEIFVPLGFVQRKERPKYSNDHGSLETDEEFDNKAIPISNQEFFEKLQQKQTDNNLRKRIAIIGEPGAGKTTQLQKIGNWVLQETDGLPIWISLSSVGEKSLREYLTNDWLQSAIQDLEISQQVRDKLGNLLKTGKVWLLLDGVDEMAGSDVLNHMASQMREGWFRNVDVVLTCRSNVWDAGKNVLSGFEEYRTLDFTYPSEVHLFIDKWFVAEAGLQQNLKVALEQPGKERIRDIVKNPLRLTLLCYSWQLQQEELPETQTGLYEWFVDAFYEWNKNKIPIKFNSQKQQELHDALGELAKNVINQQSSLFHVRKKLVNQFLGDVDDEMSLFYLALQLGWLNCIGISKENPLENIYAFLHPTFQEYFAALAIDDWSYFLPPESNNETLDDLPEEDIHYRIFEPKWLQIVLFWIGRSELNKNIKQDFIDSLVSFEDVCIGCYDDRAFFLSARIISEFSEYVFAEEIIDQLVRYAFGYYDNSEWIEAPEFITETAKAIIPHSNQKKLFSVITKTFELKPDSIQIQLANLLLDISKI